MLFPHLNKVTCVRGRTLRRIRLTNTLLHPLPFDVGDKGRTLRRIRCDSLGE